MENGARQAETTGGPGFIIETRAETTPEPTQTEAMHRIQTAMEGLSEAEAVQVAEIVEKVTALRKSGS